MIIYMIKNTVNGKIYIGQTVQPLGQRWSKHINARKNTYLANALDKYGRKSFTIEQIDSAVTLEELNQKEEHWIEHYNSTDREVGYNIKAGGENRLLAEETKLKIGLSNSGKKASEETKLKQSLARKGKKLSEETCRRMSESRKGRIVSEETREKLREKRKSYTPSEETRRKMSEAKKGKLVHTKEKYAELGEKQKGIKRPEVGEKLRGRKRDQETLDKISKANAGKKRTPEQKAYMASCFQGGRTGQKNKPESIAKMMETKRLKKEQLMKEKNKSKDDDKGSGGWN